MALEFTEDAVKLIAKKAMERKTGARGLRSIIEDCMLEIMYSLPSEENVSKCIITKDTVSKKKAPELIYKSKKDKKLIEAEQSVS